MFDRLRKLGASKLTYVTAITVFGLAPLASAQQVPLPKIKPTPIAASTASTTTQSTAASQGFQSIGSTETETVASEPKTVSRFVVDQAQVLNDESEFRLTKALAEFQAQRDVQVVFMTTTSLQGFKIDDYTNAVSQQWNVASREDKPGILVVLAPNEKVVKIHVGPGLNTWMSDRLADHLIAAYMIPSFRAGDWQNGLIRGAAGIIAVLGREAPLTQTEVSQAIQTYEEQVAQANAAQQAQPNVDQATSTEPATAIAPVQNDETAALIAASQALAAQQHAAGSTASGLSTMLLWPLLALLLALAAVAFFLMRGKRVTQLTDDAPAEDPKTVAA